MERKIQSKILGLAALAVCCQGFLLGTASCNKEPAQLSLQYTSVSFGCMGGRESLSVSANYPWKATPASDWVVADCGESSLSLTVSPNTSSGSRKTQVMVECEGLRVTLTVSQDEALLSLSEDSYSRMLLGEEGGDFTLPFSTNVDGTEASSSVPWISILPSSKASDLHPGSVSFRVQPNPSFDDRSGEITLSALSTITTVKITQSGSPRVISIVHSLERFTLPSFGDGTYGYLYWDGTQGKEDYEKGLTHEYASSDQHRVSLHLHGAAQVSFGDLFGVSELDLSGMRQQ